MGYIADIAKRTFDDNLSKLQSIVIANILELRGVHCQCSQAPAGLGCKLRRENPPADVLLVCRTTL